LLVALNETEQELKSHFQTATALKLFQEVKLTIGKAIQLSGLTRLESGKVTCKKQNTGFDTRSRPNYVRF